MEIYECPADGCDYEGVRESVLGHYSGKPDERHDGGYHDAKQQLADSQETQTPDPDDASEPNPADGDENGNEPHRTTPNSDPVLGDDPPDVSTPTSTCPDCGSHDHFDPKQILRGDYQLDDDEQTLLREHDHVCADCGEVFDT